MVREGWGWGIGGDKSGGISQLKRKRKGNVIQKSN